MPIRTAILLCLGVLMLVGGCAQRETDIGSDAIMGMPTDTFLVTTERATVAVDFHPRLTNGYGPSLQVGDVAGMYAFFAMQFNLPAALPDSVVLDTVRLRLCRNRVWPSSSVGGLHVRIRETTVPWQEDSILIGQLAGREDFPVLDSLFISAQDSFFFWDVPPELWTRWLAGDSNASGILIEPRESGVLMEFYSSEPRGIAASILPAVLIRGTRWDEVDGVWDDTTFSVDLPAAEDGYVVLDSTPRDPERLFITQGWQGRGALYFPLGSLSGLFTRAVNRAELHLFADTTHPAQVTYRDQNILFAHGSLSDTLWIAHPSEPDSFHLGFESSTVGTWDATNTEYTLDVSGVVADWVANPSRNGGLQLYASDESSFLARQVFFSPAAEDSTKRPRLVIWYSESSP